MAENEKRISGPPQTWFQLANRSAEREDGILQKTLQILIDNKSCAQHDLPNSSNILEACLETSSDEVKEYLRAFIDDQVATLPAICFVAPKLNADGTNTRVPKRSILNRLPLSQTWKNRFPDCVGFLSNNWVFDSQYELSEKEKQSVYTVTDPQTMAAILAIHKSVKHIEIFDHKPAIEWLEAIMKCEITSLKLDLCCKNLQERSTLSTFDFGHQIATLKELKELQLINVNIDDDDIDKISVLKKLEFLSLDGIDEVTGENLNKFQNLKKLSICNCSNLTPKHLKRALKYYARRKNEFEMLEISAMPLVMSNFYLGRRTSDDSIFKMALELFPKLKVLRYNAYEKQVNLNVDHVASTSTLEELAIKPNIWDKSGGTIEKFFESVFFNRTYTALRKLHISSIGWFEWNGTGPDYILKVLRFCPQLEVFEFEDTIDMPLTSWYFEPLSFLRELWLTTKVPIVELSILPLINQYPNLSFIKLVTNPSHSSPKLSEKFLESLTLYFNINPDRKLQLSVPHYSFENEARPLVPTTFGKNQNLIINFDLNAFPNSN